MPTDPATMNRMFGLGNIGPLEILVVLIIALIVFGPKRLPELGNSLGRGIREFRSSVSGEKHDEADAPAVEASPATPSAEKPHETESSRSG
jgi:TatA/E family protein of Tat protein translocase